MGKLHSWLQSLPISRDLPRGPRDQVTELRLGSRVPSPLEVLESGLSTGCAVQTAWPTIYQLCYHGGGGSVVPLCLHFLIWNMGIIAVKNTYDRRIQ